ncbi:MAG: zinc ribbon domain-containing protein [Lachnospiraceae bacterium]|jgi:uncharacterized Zn finger protein (UPF0148 family)|nr:zinc ribbon domain-containing protein [Lachnospiraceae bacterium]MCI1726481.1 zinc ribbon domain-containing protein [Lachnospiraceae bacterium]
MSNDFFEDLGKHFSDAANTAASKTNVFFETQKLTAQMNGEQKTIDKLYQAVGEAFYRKGNPPEEYKEMFAEIKMHLGQVEVFKKNIAELKGQKICPKCGAAVNSEDSFCPKCGALVPTAEKPAGEAEEAAADGQADDEEKPADGDDPAEETTGDKIAVKAAEMHDEVVDALNKAKKTVQEETDKIKDDFS